MALAPSTRSTGRFLHSHAIRILLPCLGPGWFPFPFTDRASQGTGISCRTSSISGWTKAIPGSNSAKKICQRIWHDSDSEANAMPAPSMVGSQCPSRHVRCGFNPNPTGTAVEHIAGHRAHATVPIFQAGLIHWWSQYKHIVNVIGPDWSQHDQHPCSMPCNLVKVDLPRSNLHCKVANGSQAHRGCFPLLCHFNMAGGCQIPHKMNCSYYQ